MKHLLLLTRLEPHQSDRLAAAVAAAGAHLSRDEAAASQSGTPVTAILGGPPPELVDRLQKLDWVQLRTDCLEAWGDCLRQLHARGVTVTRTRGSFNDTVPDHALMLLLAFSRDLPTLLRRQRLGEWRGDDVRPVVLAEATVVIIGLGSIGGAIARRATALGLRVIGVDPGPLEVPAEVARVVDPADLLDVLGEADFVISAAPLTPATERLLDGPALQAMKRGAVLINVSRGRLVDTGALLQALESGHLAGAGLDVVEPSPLPEYHPLWKHPRVMLTCHSAQQGSRFAEAQFEALLDNVRRYLAGDPLRHIVTPDSA